MSQGDSSGRSMRRGGTDNGVSMGISVSCKKVLTVKRIIKKSRKSVRNYLSVFGLKLASSIIYILIKYLFSAPECSC